MPAGSKAGQTANLAGLASAERGLGVLWTLEGSEDLNANLVRFEAEKGSGSTPTTRWTSSSWASRARARSW
jgi:hypothetical protein